MCAYSCSEADKPPHGGAGIRCMLILAAYSLRLRRRAEAAGLLREEAEPRSQKHGGDALRQTEKYIGGITQGPEAPKEMRSMAVQSWRRELEGEMERDGERPQN